MTNFNYDLFKVSKITNFKLRVMEQPVKLSQGTRKEKTNNYFVYRYTFIFFLKKKKNKMGIQGNW